MKEKEEEPVMIEVLGMKIPEIDLMKMHIYNHLEENYTFSPDMIDDLLWSATGLAHKTMGMGQTPPENEEVYRTRLEMILFEMVSYATETYTIDKFREEKIDPIKILEEAGKQPSDSQGIFNRLMEYKKICHQRMWPNPKLN